ncbi:hypothetical protein D9615_008974 [Tricholomella constricta]|uniref:Uncharacterized protein n=1 Tax=Tricholomella constricta TaxID=117010 RepID=A0A8H5H105_9AGAR|nr:hypothetical protein D9615_008974 [Tricholomella constricta]
MVFVGIMSILSMLLCLFQSLSTLPLRFTHRHPSPLVRLMLFFTLTSFTLVFLGWACEAELVEILATTKPTPSSRLTPLSTPAIRADTEGTPCLRWLTIISIAIAIMSTSAALLGFRPPVNTPRLNGTKWFLRVKPAKRRLTLRITPTRKVQRPAPSPSPIPSRSASVHQAQSEHRNGPSLGVMHIPPLWLEIVRRIFYGLVIWKCVSSIGALFRTAIIPEWFNNIAGLLAFIAAAAATLLQGDVYGVVNTLHLQEPANSDTSVAERDKTLCQSPSSLLSKKKFWLFPIGNESSSSTPSRDRRRRLLPRSPLSAPPSQESTASTAFSSSNISGLTACSEGSPSDASNISANDGTSRVVSQLGNLIIRFEGNLISEIDDDDDGDGDDSFVSALQQLSVIAEGGSVDVDDIVSLTDLLVENLLHPGDLPARLTERPVDDDAGAVENISHPGDLLGRLVDRPVDDDAVSLEDLSHSGDPLGRLEDRPVDDDTVSLTDLLVDAADNISNPTDLLVRLADGPVDNKDIFSAVKREAKTVPAVVIDECAAGEAVGDRAFILDASHLNLDRSSMADMNDDDSLPLFTEAHQQRCGFWVLDVEMAKHLPDALDFDITNNEPEQRQRCEDWTLDVHNLQIADRVDNLSASYAELGFELDGFAHQIKAVACDMAGDESPPATPPQVPTINLIGPSLRRAPAPTPPPTPLSCPPFMEFAHTISLSFSLSSNLFAASESLDSLANTSLEGLIKASRQARCESILAWPAGDIPTHPDDTSSAESELTPEMLEFWKTRVATTPLPPEDIDALSQIGDRDEEENLSMVNLDESFDSSPNEECVSVEPTIRYFGIKVDAVSELVASQADTGFVLPEGIRKAVDQTQRVLQKLLKPLPPPPSFPDRPRLSEPIPAPELTRPPTTPPSPSPSPLPPPSPLSAIVSPAPLPRASRARPSAASSRLTTGSSKPTSASAATAAPRVLRPRTRTRTSAPVPPPKPNARTPLAPISTNLAHQPAPARRVAAPPRQRPRRISAAPPTASASAPTPTPPPPPSLPPTLPSTKRRALPRHSLPATSVSRSTTKTAPPPRRVSTAATTSTTVPAAGVALRPRAPRASASTLRPSATRSSAARRL